LGQHGEQLCEWFMGWIEHKIDDEVEGAEVMKRGEVDWS
jgi:hypothetical protein